MNEKRERMLGCREQASKASKGVRRGSFLSLCFSLVCFAHCRLFVINGLDSVKGRDGHGGTEHFPLFSYP